MDAQNDTVPHVPSALPVSVAMMNNASGSGDQGELPVKRKRGRPRKQETEAAVVGQEYMLVPGYSSAPPEEKRGRGRPKGSGKLQGLAALGGISGDIKAGSDFTPRMFQLHTGENIFETINSFSQSTPDSICVLSASGTLSRADIRQSGSRGGIIRYEGHFDIVSLRGSHTYTDCNNRRAKNCLLSVKFVNPEGQFMGGAVGGSLIVAGPTLLVMATFREMPRQQMKMRNRTEPSKRIKSTVAAAPSEAANVNPLAIVPPVQAPIKDEAEKLVPIPMAIDDESITIPPAPAPAVAESEKVRQIPVPMDDESITIPPVSAPPVDEVEKVSPMPIPEVEQSIEIPPDSAPPVVELEKVFPITSPTIDEAENVSPVPSPTVDQLAKIPQVPSPSVDEAQKDPLIPSLTIDQPIDVPPVPSPAVDEVDKVPPVPSPSVDQATEIPPAPSSPVNEAEKYSSIPSPIVNEAIMVPPVPSPQVNEGDTVPPITSPPGYQMVEVAPDLSLTIDQSIEVPPISSPPGDQMVEVGPVLSLAVDQSIEVPPISSPPGDQMVEVAPVSSPTVDQSIEVARVPSPTVEQPVEVPPISSPSVDEVDKDMNGPDMNSASPQPSELKSSQASAPVSSDVDA